MGDSRGIESAGQEATEWDVGDELAAHRGGRLVSFDRRLSGEGIAGGREALWLIEA
jgi:hypothetical protein